MLACWPLLSSFAPVGEWMGFNLLADAAVSGRIHELPNVDMGLHQPGAYNTATTLPP